MRTEDIGAVHGVVALGRWGCLVVRHRVYCGLIINVFLSLQLLFYN